MPILAFNHFNLRANKELTAKLLDFYMGIVGLRDGWRPLFEFPGYWLYLGDSPILHLVVDETIHNDAGTGNRIFDHIAFSCSDLPALEKLLHERGIVPRRAEIPGTSQVQLFVSDPAGNGVEFNFASSQA